MPASAVEIIADWSSRIDPSIRRQASRVHRRVSVATTSLRERPMRTWLASSPTSSASQRSTSVWMSSSGSSAGTPDSRRLSTRSSPARIRSRAAASSSPASVSSSIHARSTASSYGHRRQSRGRERLIRSSSGAGPPPNRPPQSRSVSSLSISSSPVRTVSRASRCRPSPRDRAQTRAQRPSLRRRPGGPARPSDTAGRTGE